MPGKRTMFYRLSAAALTKSLKLSKEEAAKIGMTKLGVVGSGRPDIGKRDLMSMIDKTVSEVRAVIGGKSGAVNPVTFGLNKSQRARLEKALKKFGADENGRVAALMKMVDKLG